MRISVLDNHSNFTIKFTATYCNSAKHISYFLIRPSGMCTFCSLSGIFRANQIYNLPFNGYRICDVFGDRFSSQGWQNHVGDIFNIRNRSPTETLANNRFQHRWSLSIEKGLKLIIFILSISSNFDKNVNFLNWVNLKKLFEVRLWLYFWFSGRFWEDNSLLLD